MCSDTTSQSPTPPPSIHAPPPPVNDRHDLYGEWGENFPIFSAKMVQIPQKALRQEPSSAQGGGGGKRGVKSRVDMFTFTFTKGSTVWLQACELGPSPLQQPCTLQMKGRCESYINVWFPFMYSQKWNCALCSLLISKTEWSVPQFLHSYICERFIFFKDRSVYFSTAKYVAFPGNT
jgi:hypothetical protein